MRFSIIIPVLNEARTLRRAIASARACGGDQEIIVVDGGSRDGSPEIATREGARLIVSPVPQRARQMNMGASAAKGEVLLFLHADTLLPRPALRNIRRALQDCRVIGGAFARRYGSPSLILHATCLLAGARGHLTGWFLGDQAIFLRRPTFARLGGYAEMDRFEDLDLALRMKHEGRTVLLHSTVVSSARRFRRSGPFVQSCRDAALMLRYWATRPRLG